MPTIMEAEEISGSKRRWRKSHLPPVSGGDGAEIPHFLTIWGLNFHTEILCCPKCGEVYLPEALVKGHMADVERDWKISR